MEQGLSHIKSKIPAVNITLLSLLEDALKRAPDTEFLFLSDGNRVTLREYWMKVSLFNLR